MASSAKYTMLCDFNTSVPYILLQSQLYRLDYISYFTDLHVLDQLELYV